MIPVRKSAVPLCQRWACCCDERATPLPACAERKMCILCPTMQIQKYFFFVTKTLGAPNKTNREPQAGSSLHNALHNVLNLGSLVLTIYNLRLSMQ